MDQHNNSIENKIDRIETSLVSSINDLKTRADNNDQLVEELRLEVIELRERLDAANDTANFNDPTFINSFTNTLLEKYNERQIRSKNIIMFNLPHHLI